MHTDPVLPHHWQKLMSIEARSDPYNPRSWPRQTLHLITPKERDRSRQNKKNSLKKYTCILSSYTKDDSNDDMALWEMLGPLFSFFVGTSLLLGICSWVFGDILKRLNPNDRDLGRGLALGRQ